MTETPELTPPTNYEFTDPEAEAAANEYFSMLESGVSEAEEVFNPENIDRVIEAAVGLRGELDTIQEEWHQKGSPREDEETCQRIFGVAKRINDLAKPISNLALGGVGRATNDIFDRHQRRFGDEKGTNQDEKIVIAKLDREMLHHLKNAVSPAFWSWASRDCDEIAKQNSEDNDDRRVEPLVAKVRGILENVLIEDYSKAYRGLRNAKGIVDSKPDILNNGGKIEYDYYDHNSQFETAIFGPPRSGIVDMDDLIRFFKTHERIIRNEMMEVNNEKYWGCDQYELKRRQKESGLSPEEFVIDMIEKKVAGAKELQDEIERTLDKAVGLGLFHWVQLKT